MTLRDEVHNNPACAAALAAKDLDALAAIVSEGRKLPTFRTLGERSIVSAACLGPIAGEEFLTKLEAVANSGLPEVRLLKRMMKYLQSDAGLDLGDPASVAQIDALVGMAGITQYEVDAVKSLALEDAPVSRWEIEEACFYPDGTEK